MTSLAANAAHLLGACLGFLALTWMARARLPDRIQLVAALILSGAMAVFLLRVSDPPNAFEDFEDAYLAAGRAVLHGPAALRPLLEEGVNGFVNLPILAYLFTPFALLPDTLATAAFFALGAGALLFSIWLLARRYRLSVADQTLALFAVACFGPLIYSLREGNTSHILLALIVLGLACAGKRRDIAAGLAFAGAALIKPPLLLIGVYYACRGRLRVAASGFALCLAAFAASVAVFGWDMHQVWISEFRAYAGQPMPAFNVQSVAGALLRFELGPDSYRDWTPIIPSLVVRLCALAAVIALFAAGVWAIWKQRPRADRSFAEQDLGPIIVLAFICVASTVSWSHYYVWLLPAFAYLLAETRSESQAPQLRPWLIAAFILCAPLVMLSGQIERGGYEPFSGLIISHLLFGGLLLYAALLRIAIGVKRPSAAAA